MPQHFDYMRSSVRSEELEQKCRKTCHADWYWVHQPPFLVLLRAGWKKTSWPFSIRCTLLAMGSGGARIERDTCAESKLETKQKLPLFCSGRGGEIDNTIILFCALRVLICWFDKRRELLLHWLIFTSGTATKDPSPCCSSCCYCWVEEENGAARHRWRDLFLWISI